MAIPENRLSTEPVISGYIPPEERNRPTFIVDYEGGPKAIADTSGGMNYQNWTLAYDGTNIILIPELEGSQVFLLAVVNCEQISFCFDKNARPSVVYIINNIAYLYWYDTVAGMFVTTPFTGVYSAMLSLDDKRTLQTNENDILFWYTKETSLGVYNLYHRRQRDRFLDEILMRVGTFPYVYKVGMHDKLRGQIVLTDSKIVSIPPTLPPGPSNPQANLDFELGDIYWTKTGDFVIDIADPFTGMWSARLSTIAPAYSSLENAVLTKITPAGSLLIGCVVKGSTTTTIKLGVKYYNSASALLLTETIVRNVTTSWTQILHVSIAPPDAVYAKIFVETDDTNGTISFDNFTFYETFGANAFTVELDASVFFEVELTTAELFEIEI